MPGLKPENSDIIEVFARSLVSANPPIFLENSQDAQRICEGMADALEVDRTAFTNAVKAMRVVIAG